MTTVSTQHTERLTRGNTLLLLVDHQVGLYTGVRDIDIIQLSKDPVAQRQTVEAVQCGSDFSTLGSIVGP